MMRDDDFLQLCGLVALLAIAGLLQMHIIKKHAEVLIRHDEDIKFLRLVARETEKRLADD